jgi:hypothetical protein
MTNPQNPSPSGLYAFAECELVDLQNGGVLLIDKYGDGQLMAAPEVAQSMRSCRVYRTIEEHVEVLTSTIPQLAGQHEDVRKVLGMIGDAGLLVSAESVCERLNADVSAPVDLPPTRVFIITCDRPEAVERLLESMLRAGNLTRHEELFLIDDSREPGNARQNRELAEKFNFTCPRNMHYVGATEQKLLMDKLIAGLPEHEQGIRFLIDRGRWSEQKSYGLARNLCLLLSVDRRAIVLDDDVICAAVESPHKSSGLQFGDKAREVDFYSSEQDILQRTARADFDPLSGHAQCLGLNIGQAMARLSGEPITPAMLHGASSAYLSQWTAESPVLVTQTGTIGDPGTVGTHWIYTLDANSTRRLAQHPGGLEGALENRHYWMGQPRPMFAKMGVMSQTTGLDNSRLLPPYFPVFRGEDYLFGAMMEYTHPQSAVLEYAWSVPHFPMEKRTGNKSPAPLDAKGKINPSKYVTDRTRYEPGVESATRLENLAVIARELSQMTDRGLLTLFRSEVAEAQGAELVRLSSYLQDGSIRPPVWQDWLQQSINNINSSMQTAAQLSDIQSLPETNSATSALEEFRCLAGNFSSALSAWPGIRAVAATATTSMLGAGEFTP